MILWLLLSCADEPPEPRHLVSPLPGVRATTPWIPVQFELRRTEVDAAATMTLDGVDVTDPLGFNRFKAKKWGGLADHLASLDLRDLAPGEHTLDVIVGERSGSATFTFDPEPCRIDAWVDDPNGTPLAARVLVFYEGHRLDLGNPTTAIDPRGRDLAVDAFYVLPERGGSVFLPCRDYTLLATQDLRREVGLQEVSLVEGEPATVRFTLPVAVETPGEHSADLHLHTGRSQDAFLADQQRVETIAAAGLEVVVVTDHDHVSELGPSFDAVLGEGAPVLVHGVERDLSMLGDDGEQYLNTAHVNVFPVDPVAELPPERHDAVEQFVSGLRALEAWVSAPSATGQPLLQLNHPRGIHFREVEPIESYGWGLFSHMGLDRSLPPGEGANAWMDGCVAETGVTALDFDVLEVLNRFSLSLYREVRADWFALLGHGVVFTGTGNSDSHGLVIEAAGFPVNLVEAPLPVDDESLAAWLEAVAEGRVRVSTGPIVGLEIDGDTARVRVQAASWVPVHHVRLIVNGHERVVVRDPVADADGRFGALDEIWEFSLGLERDSWVVAEAGWPLTCARDPELLGLYADVAPDHVPLGFTNPVFVDVDGDGVWTPPGVR